MPHDPEVVAELGAECADDRNVPRQVNQHHREPARREQIPGCGPAAVGVGQRQPDRRARAPGRARSRPMANKIRMAALTAVMTKPRPASTTTKSMTHSADGDQYRLVR